MKHEKKPVNFKKPTGWFCAVFAILYGGILIRYFLGVWGILSPYFLHSFQVWVAFIFFVPLSVTAVCVLRPKKWGNGEPDAAVPTEDPKD